MIRVPTMSRHGTSGVRCLDLVGDVGCGFPEHLDPPLSRCLCHGVGCEGVGVRGMADQQIAHLDHVEQSVAVVPHRSIASASTRSSYTRAEPCFSGDVHVVTEQIA